MDDKQNREDHFYRTTNWFNLFFLVSGLLLFLIFKPDLISGFGLAIAILSVFSHFKIREICMDKDEVIKVGSDMSLLLILIIAVVVLIVNNHYDGPVFNTGCALGTALGAGMIYCLVLIKRFFDQI
ncbi:MAG: hypothetical protein HKN67_04065 [Saprospiraceae bacterium]|nr:hypothetical protein [Bacteroidia bacterium]NNF21093.1 hypothetical protein [Saprospiraceae bacterium]